MSIESTTAITTDVTQRLRRRWRQRQRPMEGGTWIVSTRDREFRPSQWFRGDVVLFHGFYRDLGARCNSTETRLATQLQNGSSSGNLWPDSDRLAIIVRKMSVLSLFLLIFCISIVKPTKLFRSFSHGWYFGRDTSKLVKLIKGRLYEVCLVDAANRSRTRIITRRKAANAWNRSARRWRDKITVSVRVL